MNGIDPFAVYDCSLVRRATGAVCVNLRELSQALHAVSDMVLEHHMMRCVLDDYFELYEFPNDLARWSWDGLGDHSLGEQLGLVDPYRVESMTALRTRLVDLIEGRLWSTDRVPWARPGFELPLIESRLIAYDTGERIETPAALVEAIERMPLRSLFFHVHEARRRTGGRTDDFTAWLEGLGVGTELVNRIRGIDFYFLNLRQLREELLTAFHESLMGATVPGAATKTGAASS